MGPDRSRPRTNPIHSKMIAKGGPIAIIGKVIASIPMKWTTSLGLPESGAAMGKVGLATWKKLHTCRRAQTTKWNNATAAPTYTKYSVPPRPAVAVSRTPNKTVMIAAPSRTQLGDVGLLAILASFSTGLSRSPPPAARAGLLPRRGRSSRAARRTPRTGAPSRGWRTARTGS